MTPITAEGDRSGQPQASFETLHFEEAGMAKPIIGSLCVYQKNHATLH
jgi:hypothetical protein